VKPLPLTVVRYWALMAMMMLLVSGCTNLRQRPADAHNSMVLSGRLAITIEAQERHTFSSEFELSGSPAAGSLQLMGPFGQTVVEATWTTDGAKLLQPPPARQFETINALTEQLLGAAIPIPALMQWLDGRESTTWLLPGWHLDDTRRSAGQLTAVRTQPAPRVELRLLLEPGSNTDNRAP
jgi:outer membrane lipoprotein LolB